MWSKVDRRILCCALLLVLAFFLRAAYAHSVLCQFPQLTVENQTSYQMGYLAPDSESYLSLATALSKGHPIQDEALLRPIGYPAFICIFDKNPRKILYAQALLLSLVPVCVFVMVNLFINNSSLSLGAGLVSCISPSGI